ncbi:paired-like homeodomain transcription factor LEUTX [Perognathus longimembris pacificus]|uniref:paired-like homeodomain transcription factor LEUTX n=1 Tax=Perognathus longimembris pacificus TaxID=214514 RepID=UPI00201A19E9|nr:paired-like homeodomain transcription factor LEUTX [Perognathus longimembris pacificus]
MAARARSARRSRTKFTQHQLAVLMDTFQHTQHPKWDKVNELASTLRLDHTVVRAWFKNQLSKLKKQREAGETPGSPESMSEEASKGAQAPGARSLSPQLPPSNGAQPGPQCPRQCAVDGSPGLSFPEGSEPLEALELSLTAPLPYSTEELAHIYGVCADEDPSSLDAYLLGEPAM